MAPFHSTWAEDQATLDYQKEVLASATANFLPNQLVSLIYSVISAGNLNFPEIFCFFLPSEFISIKEAP